jgi:hypothetical protein
VLVTVRWRKGNERRANHCPHIPSCRDPKSRGWGHFRVKQKARPVLSRWENITGLGDPRAVSRWGLENLVLRGDMDAKGS